MGERDERVNTTVNRDSTSLRIYPVHTSNRMGAWLCIPGAIHRTSSADSTQRPTERERERERERE